MTAATLAQTIGRYYEQAHSDPDGRERSWDHCYGFFREHCRDLAQVKETAALHLGFYLASWGMYRPSGFLWRHTYTAHIPVICTLASPKFSELLHHDIGSQDRDVELAPTIIELVQSVKVAYQRFGNASDLLATKVLLGTVGCLPACDRYVKNGFAAQKLLFSRLDRGSVDRILQFCVQNRMELAEQQSKIDDCGGPRYPLMKLVDMHFWQIGYELEST
ncbi:MAG: hypothetical protein F4Y47_04895 [Acidobacteriia bacterium]|nr:hypothetical protein [Terriglobia bacterium]MYG01895.1 hypothetical protein [Terriglobia bacterium]MYK10556.1 hypothetical protein [Terriglobia bacterium]